MHEPSVALTPAQRADLALLAPRQGNSVPTERADGELTLKALGLNDYELVAELHWDAELPILSRELAEWRYFRRNPGLVLVSGAFDAGGRLIGIYPATLRPARALGRDCLISEATHTVIHPDSRGGGRAYLALMRFHFERCDAMGVHFGYGGGANEAARKFGAWTMGIQTLLTLRTRERRLSIKMALGKHMGGVGRGLAGMFDPLSRGDLRSGEKGVEVTRVSDTDADFDDLWMRKRDDFVVLLRRDAREVRWRWLDCPVAATLITARRDGRLEGYAAMRHHEDNTSHAQITTVLDLFGGRDPKIVSALLRGAGWQAVAAGSDFLHVAPQAGGVAAGLVSGRRWRDARKHPEIVIVGATSRSAAEVGMKDAVEAALEGRNWHYCQGDSDFGD
ncbi:MAG TPA: hypothetical protein VGC54_01465 [Planctomycetota bacterium]